LVQATTTRPKITATTEGEGVVSHAGTRLLADVADAAGAPAAVSEALAGLRVRRPGHDPGCVFTDLAVMLADGGEAISDLAVLRDQPTVFGPVASTATAWRVLDAVDDAALGRVRDAQNTVNPPAAGRSADHSQIGRDLLDDTLVAVGGLGRQHRFGLWLNTAL
jgi:Transposase DDE domain group 1